MSSFQRKTGLGKGLSALLDNSDVVQQSTKSEIPAQETNINPGQSVGEIELSSIEINPYQPRTEFDQVALNELAESIKIHGLIQPITVRKMSEGKFQLISGERRFRASSLAGLKRVPAYVRTADNQQMLEMALIENIQREDLNAIEVAYSFQRMLDECDLKQEQLGERVGKNRATVSNYLRLLKLPAAIQTSIRDQKISMGHARALVNVDDLDKQLYIHQEIIDKGLSVRKVEELVRNIHEIGNKTPVNKTQSFEVQKLQEDLSTKFSSRVRLKVGNQGKGAIEIPFRSQDDLNRILELLDW